MAERGGEESSGARKKVKMTLTAWLLKACAEWRSRVWSLRLQI